MVEWYNLRRGLEGPMFFARSIMPMAEYAGAPNCSDKLASSNSPTKIVRNFQPISMSFRDGWLWLCPYASTLDTFPIGFLSCAGRSERKQIKQARNCRFACAPWIYLEDHPRTWQWLVTMVIVGFVNSAKIAFGWPLNGGY